MRYYSTNNNAERVDFDTALLNGMASNNGLYMPEFIPRLSQSKIKDMKGAPYADIAYTVLSAFLDTIPSSDLKSMLDEAYDESVIPTKVQQVADNKHILWLTKGPTYSFKDYAARFYGRALNYVLGKRGERRTVFVATSGDTGGAIADALYGLENIDVVIFYPKNSISKGQRRQMTTLKNNVYAYEVNGDFDVCQALAKYFLRDKQFALDLTGDKDNFTSANSISIGRLLPQSVFPFYAYAHIDGDSI
ncbi:threonine synthase, partial [Candidatus Woesearchaeota archaeon CG10_big_fil_rev_8_21_14_0_10_34_8]